MWPIGSLLKVQKGFWPAFLMRVLWARGGLSPVVDWISHISLYHLVHRVMNYLFRLSFDLPSERSTPAHERELYAVRSQNYLLIKFYLSWTNFCLFSKWGRLASSLYYCKWSKPVEYRYKREFRGKEESLSDYAALSQCCTSERTLILAHILQLQDVAHLKSLQGPARRLMQPRPRQRLQ